MTYGRVAALGVLALAVAATCVARSVKFIGGQGAESPNGRWRADVAGPIDQPVLMSIKVSSTQSPHSSKSIRFNSGLPLKQPIRGGKRLIQWSADSEKCSIGSDEEAFTLTIDVAKFVGADAP